MTATAADYRFMQLALELAAQGRYSTAPNPCVGCVIVAADQTIVGQGWHQQAGSPHAEVYALEQAGTLAAGSTAYVTLEPCSHFGRTPPCADALVRSGVARVVVAMEDPNPQVSGRGIETLRAAGIAVDVGVMSTEAEILNRGFCHRMRSQRPWVVVKMASSLDGRIALANGESQWITSPEARDDVHHWRALSQAILSTATTVISDNAQLTARHSKAVQQPLRVILDAKLLLNTQHQLSVFNDLAPTLVFTPAEQSLPAHVEQLILPIDDSQHFDLTAVLEALGERQINQVWTECGAGLAGALLQAQLLDEIIIYQAPKLLGHSARAVFELPDYATIEDVQKLDIIDVRMVGVDIRIRAYAQKS